MAKRNFLQTAVVAGVILLSSSCSNMDPLVPTGAAPNARLRTLVQYNAGFNLNAVSKRYEAVIIDSQITQGVKDSGSVECFLRTAGSAGGWQSIPFAHDSTSVDYQYDVNTITLTTAKPQANQDVKIVVVQY